MGFALQNKRGRNCLFVARLKATVVQEFSFEPVIFPDLVNMNGRAPLRKRYWACVAKKQPFSPSAGNKQQVDDACT